MSINHLIKTPEVEIIEVISKKDDIFDDFPEVGGLYRNKGIVTLYMHDVTTTYSYIGPSYTDNVKACNHIFIILGASLKHGEMKLFDISLNKIVWVMLNPVDGLKKIHVNDIREFIKECFVLLPGQNDE